MKKVVLAYSGGLDTSVAVAWLKEQFDAEVVTLTVDVGGGSLRQGVDVTQATVSRDIAELGLLKAPRADGYAYLSPEDVAAPPVTPASDVHGQGDDLDPVLLLQPRDGDGRIESARVGEDDLVHASDRASELNALMRPR